MTFIFQRRDVIGGGRTRITTIDSRESKWNGKWPPADYRGKTGQGNTEHLTWNVTVFCYPAGVPLFFLF